MWRVTGCALALLAMTIGTAMAEVPSSIAYHFSSHPMISGTVVAVNDHQMVVNTDQGEQVILEMDSRTMAPRDLAPGMVMRAEFLAPEDCRFYVQRIMPIRGGMATRRLQAYANTQDSREAIARSSSVFGGYRQELTDPPARIEGWESMPQTVGDHSPGAMTTATPTTADYQFSTRPMISGRVVTVNDHRVVVETEQGQRVGLIMDSNTMVPREVGPGSILRAEFTQMKDGRYYAQRISRIGSSVADREQAYAHTRDSDVLIARNPPDCGFVSAANRNTAVSTLERREIVPTPDPVAVQSAPAPVPEKPETLPQTASHQPLVLLLGLLALGSAGLVTIVRGRMI
jgi:LPXTG-motif cell wall-anchored protein